MIIVNILAIIGSICIYTIIWYSMIKAIEHLDDEDMTGIFMLITYVFVPVTIISIIFMLIVQLFIFITYPIWKVWELSDEMKDIKKELKKMRRKK